MGMIRSYPSATTCAPIWLRTEPSFWPLKALQRICRPNSCALLSSSVSMAIRISSREMWSSCWTMAISITPSSAGFPHPANKERVRITDKQIQNSFFITKLSFSKYDMMVSFLWLHHRRPGRYIDPAPFRKIKKPSFPQRGTRAGNSPAVPPCLPEHPAASRQCQHTVCPVTGANRQRILSMPFSVPSAAHLLPRFSLRSQQSGALCGCACSFTSAS